MLIGWKIKLNWARSVIKLCKIIEVYKLSKKLNRKFQNKISIRSNLLSKLKSRSQKDNNPKRSSKKKKSRKITKNKIANSLFNLKMARKIHLLPKDITAIILMLVQKNRNLKFRQRTDKKIGLTQLKKAASHLDRKTLEIW
jgi:hypothetical protein